MSGSGKPNIPAFVSYAHADLGNRGLYPGLAQQLDILSKGFSTTFWQDSKNLRAGHIWNDEIMAAIADSRFFVLAVSNAWLASDYIRKNELPAIFRRYASDRSNTVVCPVVLEDCPGWDKLLGTLQAVPTYPRSGQLLPIADWRPIRAGHTQTGKQLAAALEHHFDATHEQFAFAARAYIAEQSPSVLVWLQDGPVLRHDPRGDKRDQAAAADPSVQRQHKRVSDLAADLRINLPAGGNRDLLPDEWKPFPAAVAAFSEFLLQDTEAVADDPLGLWSLYLTLQSFRDRLRSVESNILSAETVRKATDLIAQASLFVRQFPTIQTAEADSEPFGAVVAPDAQDIETAAENVLAQAQTAEAVSPDSIAWARDQLAKVGAGRDRKNLLTGVRNLLIKACGTAAGNLLGGLTPDHNDDAILHARIKTMLHGLEAKGFLDSFADSALSEAIGRMIAEAGKPNSAFDRIADGGATVAPQPEAPDIPIPEMVSIPAGEFLMGIPDDESAREMDDWTDDKPVHKVSVPAFQMAKYPLTVGQYRAFVEAENYTDDQGEWKDPGFPQTDDHPVVRISWNDAQAYVAWLNRRTRGGFRLPSEAEWEYGCRARTETARYWGDAWDTEGRYCWGDSKSGTAPVGDGREANDFGLYDMLGNVWEWCEDPWHDDYEGDPPNNGSAWIKDGSPGRRVVRGGSWDDIPQLIRAGVRDVYFRNFRSYFGGVRLARTLFAS